MATILRAISRRWRAGAEGSYPAELQAWMDRSDRLAELVVVDAHDGAAYLEVMIPDEESQPFPDEVIDRGYKLRTPRG